jgi:hypothetical protein
VLFECQNKNAKNIDEKRVCEEATQVLGKIPDWKVWKLRGAAPEISKI